MPFTADMFQDLYVVKSGQMPADALVAATSCLEDLANDPKVAARTRRQCARSLQVFAQKVDENARKREQLEMRGRELEVTRMELELRRAELEIRRQLLEQARASQHPVIQPTDSGLDYNEAVRQIVSRSGLSSEVPSEDSVGQ